MSEDKGGGLPPQSSDGTALRPIRRWPLSWLDRRANREATTKHIEYNLSEPKDPYLSMDAIIERLDLDLAAIHVESEEADRGLQILGKMIPDKLPSHGVLSTSIDGRSLVVMTDPNLPGESFEVLIESDDPTSNRGTLLVLNGTKKPRDAIGMERHWTGFSIDVPLQKGEGGIPTKHGVTSVSIGIDEARFIFEKDQEITIPKAPKAEFLSNLQRLLEQVPDAPRGGAPRGGRHPGRSGGRTR